ncbi:MAG: small subunit ribosomal protein [Candidatus Woesearchaeota archaeon]|nr:small subunit ribosomal protein [Candidatus Woesearchaeota archaeon]MDK2908072.1 small subunit ribosomal protein [Candidatus Woesearchaeota archaeon]
MINFDLKANAPKKECNDPKCPYHGKVRIHGRLRRGAVSSTKMDKSIVVKSESTIYVPKYNRYSKVITKLYAHKPECIDVKVGDEVLIGETRPLSKTKNFVLLKVIKKGEHVEGLVDSNERN